MKKRIIISAILAVLAGSTYSLQAIADTADVYQRGDSNDVTVNQSGLLDSTAAVDQNGKGLATITQVSNGGSAGNKVEVVQDGTATGTGNTTTINQKAGGNTLRVYQSSLTPLVSIDPTSPPNLQPFASVGMGNNTGGTALGNQADVTQNGTDNSLAAIAQMGSNNKATLVQDSSNSGAILQTGNANIASISQGSAVNTASQGKAYVDQEGSNGQATVTQTGLNNNDSATVWQDSSSSNVIATVTQSGAYNLANVTQKNSFNTAIVNQSGTGISSGVNQVTITQDGMGASGSIDTATATQLTGDSNMITINQSRGDGSAVTVTQDGSLNKATMVQN